MGSAYPNPIPYPNPNPNPNPNHDPNPNPNGMPNLQRYTDTTAIGVHEDEGAVLVDLHLALELLRRVATAVRELLVGVRVRVRFRVRVGVRGRGRGGGRVRAVRELHSGGVRVIARDVGAPLV